MIKNILVATFYFVSSAFIAWWFINEAKLMYFSQNDLVLLLVIAVSKWSIQIGAALFFLNEKKWEFIRQIGFICFVGSCILIPYCMFVFVKQLYVSFAFSVFFSTMLMIVLYYKTVARNGLSLKWFWGWLLCMAIASSLQFILLFTILENNSL